MEGLTIIKNDEQVLARARRHRNDADLLLSLYFEVESPEALEILRAMHVRAFHKEEYQLGML
jgi:hypothetical protein